MSFDGDQYAESGATVVMSTKGDLVRYDSERERYGIGSTGQVLTVASSLPTWATLTTADSVLTTQGDVLYESASGLARLGFGTSGDVLTTKGTGANPVWETPSGGATVTNQRNSITSSDTTTSSTFTDTSVALTCANSSGDFLLVANLDWIVDDQDTTRLRYMNGTTAVTGIEGSPQIKAPVPLVMAGTSASQTVKVQFRNNDNTTTLTLLGSSTAESSIVMQELN